MPKRAKNEGTIFRRKSDGRWVGRVQIGVDAAAGKKKIRTVYGATETEVLGKVAALRMQDGKALDFERQKGTLMAYLSWWLENEVKPNRAARTYEEYELAIRLYVVPFVGPKKLDRLNAIDITTWMSAVVRHKFTNNMRKRALRILRIALNRAIKLQIIDRNPADAVEMPKTEHCGKASRMVSMFPELLPYLLDGQERSDADKLVFPSVRCIYQVHPGGFE